VLDIGSLLADEGEEDGGTGCITGGDIGGKPCSFCGFAGGGVPQAASIPTMPSLNAQRQRCRWCWQSEWRNLMGLIVLEALGALLLLVLIVWWTMFSGRKNGELPTQIEQRKDHEPRD
jgi:hypothetical protein